MVFMVRYVDDFSRKHITFVRTIAEVNYLRKRFYNRVTVQPVAAA